MPVPLFGNTPLTCSFGTIPVPMVVLPMPGVPTYLGVISMAGHRDNKPAQNIFSFGMCSALLNPAVFSSGAPAPCTYGPLFAASGWVPPNPVMGHRGGQAVPGSSKCFCRYLGVISQTPLPLPVQTTP
jgi:hypothetical protein